MKQDVNPNEQPAGDGDLGGGSGTNNILPTSNIKKIFVAAIIVIVVVLALIVIL